VSSLPLELDERQRRPIACGLDDREASVFDR